MVLIKDCPLERRSDSFWSVATRCGTPTSGGLSGLRGLGPDATSVMRSGQTGISSNPLQTFGGRPLRWRGTRGKVGYRHIATPGPCLARRSVECSHVHIATNRILTRILVEPAFGDTHEPRSTNVSARMTMIFDDQTDRADEQSANSVQNNTNDTNGPRAVIYTGDDTGAGKYIALGMQHQLRRSERDAVIASPDVTTKLDTDSCHWWVA